jgi:hypothetical protein
MSFTRVQIMYKKIHPVLSAVIPEKFTRLVRIADLPSTLEQVAKGGASKDENAVPVVGHTRSVGSAGTSGVKRKGEGEEPLCSKKSL